MTSNNTAAIALLVALIAAAIVEICRRLKAGSLFPDDGLTDDDDWGQI